MKHLVRLMALFLTTSCQPPAPTPPTEQSQPAQSSPAGIFEGIATGKTRVIDLTHALNAQNPYWPGPGYAPFKYELFATLEKDGVRSGRFTMAEPRHTSGCAESLRCWSAINGPVADGTTLCTSGRY